MRPLVRRWGPWLVVAFLVGLFACGPGEPPVHVYFEDFETVCDGAPCGWERSDGTAEQATWVETVHPGEHALRLTGEVGVRGPAASPMDRAVSGIGLSATVVSRCDPGSQLQLDVLVNDASRGMVVGTASLAPADEWSAPSVVDLTFDGEITNASVTAVVITKTGSGACELGEIVLDDRAFFGRGTCG